MNNRELISALWTRLFQHLQKLFSAVRKITYSIERRLPKRFSTSEQIFFVKRLSFLIMADIPLLESVHMMHEQTNVHRHKEILHTIIEKLANGQSLSNSLKASPGVFSDFGINLISVGETTGVLSENLQYLAQELQKKQSLKRKIIGACVYPIVVVCATVGIVLFLIIYLFPKIMPVFISLHMKLPFSTRVVIGLSNGIRNFGFIVACAGLILSVFSYWFLRKSEKVKHLRDRGLLFLPMFGKLIKSYNLANSMRTLGLLLKSGVAVSDALPTTASISSNRSYKVEFMKAYGLVSRGETVSSSFRNNARLFPEIVVQIVAVGEKSGSLSASLLYLAELYENEVEDYTKNLSNLIEPILMVMMGLVVGFIAVAIITPIYGITQNLHP